jgi:hypothetical protein
MEQYVRRTIDDELDALLPDLPAIALEGPKGVWKTATASRRAATVHRLDDPAVRAVIAADPARLVAWAGGEGPAREEAVVLAAMQ